MKKQLAIHYNDGALSSGNNTAPSRTPSPIEVDDGKKCFTVADVQKKYQNITYRLNLTTATKSTNIKEQEPVSPTFESIMSERPMYKVMVDRNMSYVVKGPFPSLVNLKKLNEYQPPLFTEMKDSGEYTIFQLDQPKAKQITVHLAHKDPIGISRPVSQSTNTEPALFDNPLINLIRHDPAVETPDIDETADPCDKIVISSWFKNRLVDDTPSIIRQLKEENRQLQEERTILHYENRKSQLKLKTLKNRYKLLQDDYMKLKTEFLHQKEESLKLKKLEGLDEYYF